MSSEEDSEVILEGSELYKYLKEHGVDECDVYSPTTPSPITQMDSNLSSIDISKFASKDVLEIINAILNSNLLLEEDAIYLLQNSDELIPKNHNKVFYKLMLPTIIAVILLFTSSIIFNNYWPGMLICCAVILYYGINDCLDCLSYKSTLPKLLSNLQVILLYIRKLIKLIQEEDSLVNTKQKVFQLKNDINIVNDYTIKRKKTEISIISKKVLTLMKSLISHSRHMTLDIIGVEKQNHCTSNSSYIALYTDERLGLRNDIDELSEETDLLSLIDNMKNIYLMMQSESLRVLGLYLCRFKEAQDISKFSKICYHHKLKSSYILLELENIHKKHFYPTCVEKNIKNINSNDWHLNNVVNNISTTLNGLLIDSRNLQDFIDEHSEESTIAINQSVGQKLCDMEIDIGHLLKYLNETSQQLLKQTAYSNHNAKTVLPDKCSERVEPGLPYLTVGNSDFSVTGHDEVFLGYVESNDNYVNENDYSEEEVKPTYHMGLLDELRATLKAKHEEFEKREIQALKSDEELKRYKLCTSEYINAHPPNKIKSKACTSIVKDENSSPLNLDKDLAIKAMSLYKTWGHQNTEECFGDESDNEDA